MGGREGAFIMVTFWLVEAMSRVSPHPPPITQTHSKNNQTNLPPLQAASYDVDIPNLRKLALAHFDNILSYSNHLGMFSEEVAISGEQMGNTPQAFSHLACVSAAINLDRLGKKSAVG